MKGEAETFKKSFPVPPFWDSAVSLEQLSSFYRAVLRLAKHIVFLGNSEIIFFLQSLFREYVPGLGGEHSFYFCGDSDMALLERLVGNLPPEETVGVILPRRVEEFKLLTLSFVFPWRKVFLGSAHGIVAEVARELFLPFYPVEEGYHHFWHRGTLLYLPLLCGGIAIEELERGFQEGYPRFQEEALCLSLLLIKGKPGGWREVCFLVDSQFLFVLFQSFLPLFEKSCGGETKIRFTVKDFLSFRDISQDVLSSKKRIASTLFVVVRSGKRGQNLLFQRPSLLGKEFFFEEWHLLDRVSFHHFHRAECLALLSILRGEEASVVELRYLDADIGVAGQIMAFLHQWVCYSAWLRGLDLLSDPPISRFEKLVRGFLKKSDSGVGVG
ncbi:MAG: hypothetical protein ACP5Q4_04635, partial [Candidatus Caldatribacteriaceae bacterium]